MRYKQGLSSVILLGLSISSTTFAANVAINGTIPSQVKIHHAAVRGLPAGTPTVKNIMFQRVVLSPEAQQYLANHIEQQLKASGLQAKASNLSSSAQVGMNGVPVLDQGQHGTCVTFAVTGALDAVANDSQENGSYDRYSQLCSLELGNTLEKAKKIEYSGWDGTWGEELLKQVSKYGLVTKEYQNTQGCAGVKDYPIWNEYDHGKDMSEADYINVSEKVIPPISYKTLMKVDDAFTDRVNTSVVLDNVKKALANKHRVTFGTLLDVYYGENGAVGKYKKDNDTWILTAEIAEDAKNPDSIQAGHEMIITGYDDNAVVMEDREDNNTNKTIQVPHKGVLTLRNSWGEDAGDNGNYYMTYDHFKALVMEVSEYVPAPQK